MVQENVFTYVLGFVEKNNVLMQKNGLLARTSYQIKPLVLRLKTATSWRAWSRCRTPVAETKCFRRRLLVVLSPTLVVEKTGPIEEQAIPVWNFHLCLLCACSVHFQPVSCMFSRFWSCWQKLSMQSMSLDSVGVTRVWNLRLVRPNSGGDPDGHGLATADRQRMIKAIIDPLFKETRCIVSES